VLVEDNPGDVNLVREALLEHEVEGELIVLCDGEIAVRFVRHLDASSGACPSLVILDLNLPKQSGGEVLKAWRESNRCCHTPLIVLSSSDALQDRDYAMQAGASHYFKKPSRLQEFMDLGAIFKSLIASSDQGAGFR
jgi:two-component system, chemotaxis family, response regulator Rcp1